MRPVLLPDDANSGALHALAAARSFRLRAGDHPPRGTVILRVLDAVRREFLTLRLGGIRGKRLERIGGALVHDHSDRQLSRLLARELGTELSHRVPFRSAG